MGEVFKYTSWKIDPTALTAEYGDMSLALIPSETNFACYEGLWRPEEEAITDVQGGDGIGGVCLYDWRWGVIFRGKGENAPPVIRRLALPRDREDAEKRLKSGQSLKAMLIPPSPSIGYHANLIGWQVAQAQRHGLRRMFYHSPRAEYHVYIKRIESLANVTLADVHLQLDIFADVVEAMARDAFRAAKIELKFLVPMSAQGVKDPLESFLYPYCYPDRCGINPERMMGIEDLPEIRLEIEARKTRQTSIRVAVCVLHTLHPYADVCFPIAVSAASAA